MAENVPSFAELFIGAVTVGDRGQIVIPAAARETYGIQGGDKLLVFHHPGNVGLIIVRVQDIHRMAQVTMKLVEEMTTLAKSSQEATDPE